MQLQLFKERYSNELSRAERKEKGIFYSPACLVTYMVEHTLGGLLAQAASLDEALKIKVCDPSCGSGRFLEASLKRFLIWAEKRNIGISRAEFAKRVQRQCLFGVDVDAKALSIASAALPFANLKHGDSLEPLTWHEMGAFEVVVGNPPYGLEGSNGQESTRSFMRLAKRLLAPYGKHAFIVPKALCYSSAWKTTLLEFWGGISEIIDCGQAWTEVKLEQVIYFYEHDSLLAYRSGALKGEHVLHGGLVDKRSINEFGFALNAVSAQELRLGRKIREAGAWLGELVENQRGAMLQAALHEKKKNALPVYGGKQVQRYGFDEQPKGYLARNLAKDPRATVEPGSILAQNIVAHILNPEPHLKITATMIDSKKPVVILDTVNQLKNKSELPSEVILAILNSKLVSWYVYRFVVGKAVRTIHFDSPLTDRIPVPKNGSKALIKAISAKSRKMLELCDAKLDAEIDRLIFELYGLSSAEADLIF